MQARSDETGVYRYRILVADDLELNRTIVGAILSSADFDVDTVADGQAAVQAVATTAYDLVLMDIDMPVLDGHAASLQIRRADRVPTMPIVALSCKVSPEDREKSRLSGMDDHIARPISPRDLVDSVTRILAASAEQGDDRVLCDSTYSAIAEVLGHARMDVFLALLKTRLETMDQALQCAATTAEAIAGQAHDLVSAAGMLGFLDVSRACQALAAASRESSGDAVLPRLSASVTRALDALVARMSTSEIKA